MKDSYNLCPESKILLQIINMLSLKVSVRTEQYYVFWTTFEHGDDLRFPGCKIHLNQ